MAVIDGNYQGFDVETTGPGISLDDLQPARTPQRYGSSAPAETWSRSSASPSSTTRSG